MEKQIYIAIIGDIKQSKKLPERDTIQIQLREVLEQINKKYVNELASDFMITLGDEFQGLLKQSKSIIHIIEEIQMRMNPVKIRFGIGVGEIYTTINRHLPLGADGPAYYHARTGIDTLKQLEKKSKTHLSNILVIGERDGTINYELLNTIFSLLYVIKEDWTPGQLNVISELTMCGDNQVNLSKRLGIAQAGVSKHLLKANYYTYANAVMSVENEFMKLGGS
ncbi:SatD family protein [Anaerosporobacter faecicola]|uniref:SatD family protein n=1 Tax=Anaerosporobacter faecicola TaxID=2718714 RepID=UPI00143B1C0F|nr:SatD family protein [Anaerosporobacter faecicola]